jgi:hypothetical protein
VRGVVDGHPVDNPPDDVARGRRTVRGPAEEWPVMSRLWRLRAAVLTLAGALLVHEGRYLFAPPEHEHALAAAHTYLGWLVPTAGALLFLAFAQVAARIGRVRGEDVRLPGVGALWVGAAGCLLSVFLVQECAEGFIAHGELPLLGDILGAGGWVAVPLCAAVGGLVALLLAGAARVLRWAIARRSTPRRRLGAVRTRAVVALVPRASVLARRLAGRAPPAVS